MGDELRGENLVHLSVRFSTEKELNNSKTCYMKNRVKAFLSQDCWKQWPAK